MSGWPVPNLRAAVDAGASLLPVLCAAGLVGFGAVAAAWLAFGLVRDWVLIIDGRPLLSLVIVTNTLAALTGLGSGDLTIALGALGPTHMTMAAERGTDHGLLHRIAVIGAGTLDILPHEGPGITFPSVCGCIRRESRLDIAMVATVGSITTLALAILPARLMGSF